jgi:hypothetical protein
VRRRSPARTALSVVTVCDRRERMDEPPRSTRAAPTRREADASMSTTEPRTDERRDDARPDVEITSIANPRRVRWSTYSQA